MQLGTPKGKTIIPKDDLKSLLIVLLLVLEWWLSNNSHVRQDDSFTQIVSHYFSCHQSHIRDEDVRLFPILSAKDLPECFSALFEIHFVSLHKETLGFNTKAPAWTVHQLPELDDWHFLSMGGALLHLQLCFPNPLPGDGSGLHVN